MRKLSAMALMDEARRLCAVAERLKGSVGNEANTKALLVEPLLSALGWDATNIEHVVRDWPVHGDASIDYALRVDESTVVFVETRAVTDNLDDESFAGRTVDQVHREKVLWCVLTNGLHYMVYRADEQVPTADKLSFEFALPKAAAGSPADAAALPRLSRQALVDGSLELWGEQEVFTDPRVRKVLSALVRDPSPAFLDAVNEAIGERKVPTERLRKSIGRVLTVSAEKKGATGSSPERATAASSAARADADGPPQPAVAERTPDVPAATAGPRASAGPQPADAFDASELPEASGGPMAPESRWERPIGVDPPVAPKPVAAMPAPAPASAAATATLEPPQTSSPAESPKRRFLGVQPRGASETAAARAKVDPYAPMFGDGDGTTRAPDDPLNDYLVSKPPAIVELFEHLDTFARDLEAGAPGRIRRGLVEYSRGKKWWLALEAQHQHVVMYLPVDPPVVQAWWAQDATRSPIDVRRRGVGETEYVVGAPEQLDDARHLIRAAHDGFPPLNVKR